MMEREFITRNLKEFEIQEYVKASLRGVGLSDIKIQRTPLGEKIIISASRPGLIIGGGGSNIKKLTKNLKREFNLENPQIEINEVQDQNLVAQVVAERISISLEKYGSVRFKSIGHRIMGDVMNSGALGIEILISGKIPSARARTWRFYQGYLKKCGDPALTQVDVAYKAAKLKSGVVGIKVSIMPPDTRLPDDIKILEFQETPGLEEVEVKEDENKDKEKEEKVQKLENEDKGDKGKKA
ncbi:30S ribosomal protein S3 [Candidatus Woesearchaeota archaeon]|nr:30S ribosomal protein S3 [Candidatus Woesearchaeota archaeon]